MQPFEEEKKLKWKAVLLFKEKEEWYNKTFYDATVIS